MTTCSILREKTAALQVKLFVFQNDNKSVLTEEGKDAFNDIQTVANELSHILKDGKEELRLFPHASTIQKFFIATFHVAIILLLALVYQVYDNHKIYNQWRKEFAEHVGKIEQHEIHVQTQNKPKTK